MGISENRIENAVTTNKWLVLLTVAINGFTIVLDFSIVNLSFPVLTRVFQTEPSIVLWVTVVYALICVGLMPILGKIADIYGRKRIFILGYIIFTAGLILCSSARSISQLILFRLVQGIGGAMNMALGFAIVTDAFPSRERGKALGIMSSIFATGPLLGFTIGGLLLDVFGWRAVFYTRAPICILGILMAWKFLATEKSTSGDPKLDLLGAGILFASLSSLLLFLNMGGRQGFLSPHILLLGCIGLILFPLFILQEMRHEQPIVDLQLYRIGLFTGASISLVIFGIVQAGQLFLLPFFLQDALGYTALNSGLILAVPPLLFFAVAPLSGWLSDKLGTRPLCAVGMCFLFLGLYLMSRLSIAAGLVEIIITLLLVGIGGGLFNAPNTSQIMGAVPKIQLGSVGALATTTRQIGMSSGIAAAGVIFTMRRSYHHIQLAGKNLDPVTLDRLALGNGFSDTMLLTAFVCLIGIFTSALIGARETP